MACTSKFEAALFISFARAKRSPCYFFFVQYVQLRHFFATCIHKSNAFRNVHSALQDLFLRDKHPGANKARILGIG